MPSKPTQLEGIYSMGGDDRMGFIFCTPPGLIHNFESSAPTLPQTTYVGAKKMVIRRG